MNSVKITSGKFRGRKITTPGGVTHPMGERERLALFNMISPYLNEASVLDAFAGSGALGIEALSRGAKEVVFIEKNAKAARVIRENLRELGLEAELFIGKVADFETGQKYGVILADPPYDNFVLEEVARLVQLLEPEGIFVLSHPGEAPEIDGLKLLKSNTYAGAHLSLYKLA